MVFIIIIIIIFIILGQYTLIYGYLFNTNRLSAFLYGT